MTNATIAKIQEIAATLPETFGQEQEAIGQLQDLTRALCKDKSLEVEEALDALASLCVGGKPVTVENEQYVTPETEFRRNAPLLLYWLAASAPERSAAGIARLEMAAQGGTSHEIRYNSLQAIMNLGQGDDPHKSDAVAALERQCKSNPNAVIRALSACFLDMVADEHPDVKPAALTAWIDSADDPDAMIRSTTLRTLKNYADGSEYTIADAVRLLSVFEKAAAKNETPVDIATAAAGIDIVRRKAGAGLAV